MVQVTLPNATSWNSFPRCPETHPRKCFVARWQRRCLTCAVKLSVKSDYAVRAMLGLARAHPAGKPVSIEKLASEHGIPAKYLPQILLELKSQQLVKSVRGAEGGYLLARPPMEISLGDVLRCIHGAVFDSPALTDPGCAPELRAAWERLQTAANQAADAIHFQELADASADKAKMYYI